jgi:hypothetical protein
VDGRSLASQCRGVGVGGSALGCMRDWRAFTVIRSSTVRGGTYKRYIHAFLLALHHPSTKTPPAPWFGIVQYVQHGRVAIPPSLPALEKTTLHALASTVGPSRHLHLQYHYNPSSQGVLRVWHPVGGRGDHTKPSPSPRRYGGEGLVIPRTQVAA